jgi:hypothetical protein
MDRRVMDMSVQTRDSQAVDAALIRLPDAPLAMPKQVLERQGNGLFAGLLARIGARAARTEG